MSYQAIVIPIMIASPGDVREYRRIARDVIHEWNYVHSQHTGVVLMPVGWETNSSPELGSTAQDLINERLLRDCDLLVGVFWTRLGTPTVNAASGTVEEIRRHCEHGKPAMVYFSNAPVLPSSVDHEQYVRLGEFKRWCEGNGLVGELEDALQFKDDFRRQLHLKMHEPYMAKILSQGLGQAIEPDPSPSYPAQKQVEVLLSSEARELLMAAAEDGTLFHVEMLDGTHLQAGSSTFGTPGDPRAEARWVQAMELLEKYDLIRDKGHKREVFGVTAKGFEAIDSVQAKTL